MEKQGLQQQQLFRLDFSFSLGERENLLLFSTKHNWKSVAFLRVVLAFRVGPKFLLRIVGNKELEVGGSCILNF